MELNWNTLSSFLCIECMFWFSVQIWLSIHICDRTNPIIMKIFKRYDITSFVGKSSSIQENSKLYRVYISKLMIDVRIRKWTSRTSLNLYELQNNLNLDHREGLSVPRRMQLSTVFFRLLFSNQVSAEFVL